jgi:L-ascorbate metabolism protein UlaG (beta-lactamase superfamily)
MESSTKPRPDEVARTPDLAITWLGHASVLVELDGKRLLTDPVLRNRIGPLRRIVPAVRPHDVGPVDCVLLSHLHADHADVPTLRDLVRSGPIVAPYGARSWLTGKGLADVRELQPGQDVSVGSVTVLAAPARHSLTRGPLGPKAEPVGYVIRGSSSVYFAGDTDLFAAMAELRGSIDVALLPVSGWGPRVPAGHMDPERAAAACALIAPAAAIPIHWGTLTLCRPARRPANPERPAREFAALVNRYAPAVEVRVLLPGQRINLQAGSLRPRGSEV